MTYIDGVNAEALNKFLKALESGKYKQGTNRLHTMADDSMCCLGVATVELGPECGVQRWEGHIEGPLDVSVFYQDADERFYLLMPPSVTKFLGIPMDYIDRTSSGDCILVHVEENDENLAEDGYYRSGVKLIAVSALNDRGEKFYTIARRIRETLTKKEN